MKYKILRWGATPAVDSKKKVVDKRADNLYACVWFSFVQNNILWNGPL